MQWVPAFHRCHTDLQRNIHSAIHNLNPALEGCSDEQSFQRVPYVVEVLVWVGPFISRSHTLCPVERLKAFLPTGPELSSKHIQPKDTEDQEEERC